MAHSGQFKKGQSGNPNGRPKKGNTLADLLRAEGEKQETSGLTKNQTLAIVVWKAALDGEQWACNYIMDRTEGKPIQKVEQIGDGLPEINFTVLANKEKKDGENESEQRK